MMNEDKGRNARLRKGVIAGVAGVALLLSGTTFALWSGNASYTNNGTITAGQLAIAKGDDPIKFYDISTDRKNGSNIDTLLGSGHEITDLDTHKIVPGDTFGTVYPFTATLSGGNLVAKLSAKFPKIEVGESDKFVDNALKVSYVVYQGDSEIGKGDIAVSPTGETTKELGYFASSDSDETDIADVSKYNVKRFDNKDVTLKVLFTVTFDSNATDSMKAVRALEDITISLEQVRDTAGYYTTSS